MQKWMLRVGILSYPVSVPRIVGSSRTLSRGAIHKYRRRGHRTLSVYLRGFLRPKETGRQSESSRFFRALWSAHTSRPRLRFKPTLLISTESCLSMSLPISTTKTDSSRRKTPVVSTSKQAGGDPKILSQLMAVC